ncbi:CDGSH iron-sulfur domain-containing protein 2 [Catharus ustulatus]|uniref:CDGSH iron-sulfur domain-containing protein 2 n=1 Tax=Catharus ustulatus TaxID=91951 RepID=UPI001C5BA9A9|nr:CDGSH iron-sulfur domain-containing protein 2 [Catharus ustulatus]
MVLDTLARIVKVQLPAYLKRLPLPESVGGFIRLTATLSYGKAVTYIYQIEKFSCYKVGSSAVTVRSCFWACMGLFPQKVAET